MNTNQLKKFAQQARHKLMEQVASKLDFVLNNDTAELREKAEQVSKLKKELDFTSKKLTTKSKKLLIEKVAYIWFNRLMALRFMDANDYQPDGIRVVTPKDGDTLPEILAEAKQGNISKDLPIKPQHIYDLFDGKIPSQNPQNEAYKELLIGACNHLNKAFPFLFERINDYAELLLPNDLTSEYSIVADIRNGMTNDDCQEVEIIGWLYQFYISDRKDEVFAAKSKVAKEDIPAATQLFTPRWIVEYMVQNTVGKLWLQNRPNSSLKEYMPYYIESASAKADDYLKINSVEELTLLDQACGSGHILVYGFELLTKIYEEEGYNKSEIPQLIIENNLFGFEIDQRAAQLAGLALMMKARSYQRRLFRKDVKPNILCFTDLKLDVYQYNSSKIFTVNKNNSELNNILKTNYFIAENIVKEWTEDFEDEDTGEIITIERTKLLIKKGKEISIDDIEHIVTYGKENVEFFVDEIKDVFRKLSIPIDNILHNDIALITEATNLGSLIIPKTAKQKLINTLQLLNDKKNINDLFLRNKINELIKAVEQLILLATKYHCVADNPPYMGGGAMNKNLADFVKEEYTDSKADLMACFMESGKEMLLEKGFLGMINQHSWMFLSSYEKLREKLIQNTFFDTLLHLGARTFPEIGGEVVQNASFTFWNTTLEEKGSYIRLVDEKSTELKRVKTLQAIQNISGILSEVEVYTANQKDFEKIPGSPIGYWVNDNWLKVFDNPLIGSFGISNGQNITGDNKRFLRFNWEILQNSQSNNNWAHCARGGGFRKWYGNVNDVINWNEASRIHYRKDNISRIVSKEIRFREGITWSYITSSKSSFRKLDKSQLFEKAGTSIFFEDAVSIESVLAWLNSEIVRRILKIINPTLNYQVRDIFSVPISNVLINGDDEKINKLSEEQLYYEKTEWNSRETSWDFTQNELLKHKGQDLEDSLELYKAYWQKKFYQLHHNEEELNARFIEIYDLQEELTPDVELTDITILKDELDQKALKEISNKYNSGWELKSESFALSEALSINKPNLPFNVNEIIKQFISYAVGCMFGRYSLNHEDLHIADTNVSLQKANEKFGIQNPKFEIDDDNIIPVLDDDWFEDDIVGRFKEFLKVSFGSQSYSQNLAFVETSLGKDLRKYFIKDFYTDHIKRYKKRPIYWMFSSPKGSFNVLIYLHRYTKDTIGDILNNYLRDYEEKLKLKIEDFDNIIVSGTPNEQNKAEKEKAKLKKVLLELKEYERDVLYPIASKPFDINLDDGVLVNYNKFGSAIKQVAGLNDKKAKAKVRKFDWINVKMIKD